RGRLSAGVGVDGRVAGLALELRLDLVLEREDAREERGLVVGARLGAAEAEPDVARDGRALERRRARPLRHRGRRGGGGRRVLRLLERAELRLDELERRLAVARARDDDDAAVDPHVRLAPR